MGTKKETTARTELMDEYVKAFVQANPGKKKPAIRFESGWFLIDYALTEERYRKSKVEAMRDRLLARCASAGEK